MIPTQIPDLNKLCPDVVAALADPEVERAQNAKLLSDFYEKNTQIVSGKRKFKSDLQVKLKEQKPEYGTEQYYIQEVQKAQQAVVRKELQTVARNQLYNNPQSILPDFACLKPLKIHIDQMNGVNTASRYVYIVVSPDTRDMSQDLENLQTIARKAVNRVWIAEWLLTFEQRGVVDSPHFGKGIHLNFVIKKSDTHLKKAPTDMAREFRNTFKHVIGANCFSAVDYRYATDPTNFLHYLSGQKDEKHDPEVIMSDDVWRKENDLPSYFSSNGWGPEIAALNDYARAFYLAPQFIPDEDTEDSSEDEVSELTQYLTETVAQPSVRPVNGELTQFLI